MSIISKMRKQTAVYWGPPVESGDGDQTYPDPVEIECRWEDVNGAVLSFPSNDVLNDSTVYSDRDLEVNGYLYLGTLSEVDGLTPDEVPLARRIKGFSKLPNLRATEYLRTATV